MENKESVINKQFEIGSTLYENFLGRVGQMVYGSGMWDTKGSKLNTVRLTHSLHNLVISNELRKEHPVP